MPSTLQLALPTNPPLPEILALELPGVGAQNSFTGVWPDRSINVVQCAALHSYRVTAARAQALICVGGGYTKLVYDKEGVEIALWLNSMGIDAHILVHRLPGADSGTGGVYCKDIALQDGLKALGLLETQSGSLPLLHVGLSSGGHLAGVMACQASSLDIRGALIGYAPLNANHRQHKYPQGKADYPPVQKQDFYDDWPIGIDAYPHGLPRCPLFLAYALQDRTVPVQHALNLLETASRNTICVDAHIFGTAPHGFALRDSSGSHAQWPALAKDWIERVLG